MNALELQRKKNPPPPILKLGRYNYVSRNLPFLLLLTGHRRYIQGEIEVKVQMKENFLQLIMSHEINGEKQIGGKIKRGLDQNLQMMQENQTNLN